MRTTSLILDAGGVMVRPAHFNDWNVPTEYEALLGDHARDIPGAAWKEACRAEAPVLREDVLVHGIAEEALLRRQFLANVARRMGWALTESQLDALNWDFTWNPARYHWYADVEAALAHIHKDHRIGVLSDAMPSFREFAMQRPEARYFDAMVVSTEIGTCKPDPRMYAAICEALNVRPEECLFVDDRECNLRGALNVGMRAAQMLRDGGDGWDGPIVHDFSEIIRLLEEEH